MKKIQVVLLVVMVVSGISVIGSPNVEACEKGWFENLNGPKDVEFWQIYTYSVYPRGKFKNVNWSAAGGEVVKYWNDGKKYFAKVRWTHVHPEKGTRVKARGKDGCGVLREERFWVKAHRPVDSRGGVDSSSGTLVRARFYKKYEGQGDSMQASQDQERLSGGWDNSISSVWVAGNTQVIIYEGWHYKGRSMTLQGGQQGTLHNLPNRFNNNVSSFQIK